MKRAFSILFASLILLSGLHFTIASHICCGQLAAVKYSISGEKATCGMEENENNLPLNGVIHADCCKNNINACATDGNYFQSQVSVPEIASVDLIFPAITPEIITWKPALSRTLNSCTGPPLIKNYSPVDQSLICVFLI